MLYLNLPTKTITKTVYIEILYTSIHIQLYKWLRLPLLPLLCEVTSEILQIFDLCGFHGPHLEVLRVGLYGAKIQNKTLKAIPFRFWSQPRNVVNISKNSYLKLFFSSRNIFLLARWTRVCIFLFIQKTNLSAELFFICE